MTAEYGIPFTVGIVSALMVSIAQLRRHLALDAESTRKLMHIGSGVLAMALPWLLESAATVVAVCALSAAFLAVCRHTNLLPYRLKQVLGGVRRQSAGEYFFPLAVAILFPLARGNLALYLIPIAILTVSDTAAAMVGSRWGATRYFALAGRKSVEGSLAFFIATMVIGSTLLTVLTGLDLVAVLVIVWWLAVATTLAEAVSTAGTDNLVVPLVAYLFLSLSFGEQSYAPWIQALVIAALAVTLATLRIQHADPEGPDYLGRMRVYLAEMFPLPLRVFTAAAYFIGVASMVRLIVGSDTSLWSTWTLIGSWTLFCHMLLLRLMDELKDVDIDRELFPERPVPSGRVSLRDIQLGIVLVTVMLLVPNVAVAPAFAAAMALVVYSFLMFRYFFVPGLLRDNLIPNLATHNPVVAVLTLYAATLVATEHGMALQALGARAIALLIAFFWPAAFAWEIARKIRSAEEENAYVTYSQIFGRRRAVLVVAAAQSLTVLVGLYFSAELGLSVLFPVVLLGAFLVALAGHIRFILRPSPATSNLRPWAEGFLFGVLAAAFVEFQFGHLLNQF